MHVRFWGVRGSVAWSTPGSIVHGGNTPCIEIVDHARQTGLILDAGTGIVGLAATLGPEQSMPPILLSHYHWDHVQGLPFLPGLYHRNTAVRIWGPALDGVDERWASALFRAPFFPVALDRLPSAPSIAVVDEDELEIEGFQVRVQTLTHPGGSRAYRVAGATGDLVYVTDHEFGDPATDDALASFASGAAALVLDAHFTPEEIGANRGLGHSSWRQAAEFAACTGSARLYLFHHKPGRSDIELSDIEARASGVFAAASAAREGMGFDI